MAVRQCGSLAAWKQVKGEWQGGERAAGKNPAGMPMLVEQFVAVGDKTSDRAGHQRLARRHRSKAPHRDHDKLFKSGATIVNIHAGQRDQKRAIESYGAKILPHFAKRAT